MTEEIRSPEGTKAIITLSFEQMIEVFDRGITGVIEFRDWLSEMDDVFRTIRKEEVDIQIRKMADRQEEALEHYRKE